MKTPAREPRNEPSLECYGYYDHETVVQEDGRIAAFMFYSRERDKGWVHAGWQDRHGFWLLEGDQQIDEQAQQLIRFDKARKREPAPQPPTLTPWSIDKTIEALDTWMSSPPVRAMMADAPALESILSVQPMTGPIPGSIFHIETPAECADYEARKKAWYDGVVADLRPGEVLREYEYDLGDALSMRGGYYVATEAEPTRVLRCLQTWMS